MSEQAIPLPEGATERIATDYQIGQQNIQRQMGPFALDIHNPVFMVAGLTIVAFVILTLAFQNQVEPLFGELRKFLTTKFDWFFLLAGNIFVLVCVVIAFSPLGRIRLGGPAAKPDFSYPAWFAMLFTAGMGIGLMFYGVSEPMSHYASAFGGTTVENGVRTDWAPLGGAKDNVALAKELGMAATIFHWGLHPWAIYAVVALALALFSFNKGLPLTMRSVFYPILGDRVWGWPGHVIDVLAIFASLFGLATSLGIGAQQAGAGLHFLFGWSNSDTTLVFLIIVITAMAITSVVAGLDKGVKMLSEFNMFLAIALLLFIIVAGPTLAILSGFVTNLAAYVKHLPALSMPFGREDANFSQGWTAFYWAWWVSWSPFVGMFIARVSRGRTVREFLVCVLLIPSLVSVLWMTALGGTAIEQLVGGFAGVKDAALELKLFQMLSQLPLTGWPRSSASCWWWCSSSPRRIRARSSSTPSPPAARSTRRCRNASSGPPSRAWWRSRCCSAAASWRCRRWRCPPAFRSPSCCWAPAMRSSRA